VYLSPERRWSPEVVVTGGREIIGCRREKGKRRRGEIGEGEEEEEEGGEGLEEEGKVRKDREGIGACFGKFLDPSASRENLVVV
jgi:hypothetical protein